MANIAIIPARGGSKRVPKKNIREFLGKPIIAYSIQAAIESNLFDEIMVSTDSEEIAEIAKFFGASVPFLRKAELADDFTSTDDVLIWVLNEYEKRGRHFEYMACIYPTAPFVTSDALIEAMQVMTDRNPALVMPLVAFSYPPQRSYHIDEDGMAAFNNEKYIQMRSQDLEKWYHEIGQYYIYDVGKFIKANGQVASDIVPIIVDELLSHDIDSEQDWKMAELKYRFVMDEKNRCDKNIVGE